MANSKSGVDVHINRRKFIQWSAASGLTFATAASGVASTAFGGHALARRFLGGRDRTAADVDNPQFLILLFYSGGLDSTYLFDARPLAMTQAGLIHNLLGEDPAIWTMPGGGSTLATRMAAPLAGLKDYFSIVNGVVMETDFDGHEQNVNFALSGFPFGGECFVQHLNLVTAGSPRVAKPVDCLQWGTTPGGVNLTNLSSTVPLDETSATQLVARVQADPSLQTPSGAAHDFLSQRMRSIGGSGDSFFNRGVRLFSHATAESPRVAQALSNVHFNLRTSEVWSRQFEMILELFRAGMAGGAVVYGNLGSDIDTHAAGDATKQPEFAALAATQIARLIELLRATPYDANRSMMDLTTFVVTSEFGRSMRQPNSPIDHTGTDHNALANTLLIGGAGVRNGVQLGATDFQTAGETLSPAHLIKDAQRFKVMARPFDFANNRVRTDLPATFSRADYITFGSVANAIYSRFGVDQTKWRRDAAGNVLPALGVM